MNHSFWNLPVMHSRNKSEKIGGAEKVLGYFVGPCFVYMVYTGVAGTYLTQFYTDVLGIGGIFLTMMPLLSKLMSSIISLLIGRIIDKTRTVQGKARPWIFFSGFLVTLCGFLLYAVPKASYAVQIAWVVVSYNLFFSLAFSTYSLSHSLMVPLSTRNTKDRDNLAMLTSMGTSMIPGMLSTIIMPLLIRNVIGVGDSARGAWLTVIGCLSCVAIPAALLEYWFTRERITEENAASPKAPTASFQMQVKACFHDRYWVMVILFTLILHICNGLSSNTMLYYCNWVLASSVQEGASKQILVNMIGQGPLGIGIFALWPLVRKFGKRSVTIVGFLIAAAGALAVFLSGSNLTMVLICLMIKSIGSLPMYVMSAYMAEVIDHVEVQNGFRTDGFTASVISIITTVATGLSQTLLLAGIHAFGYLSPTSTAEVLVQPAAMRHFFSWSFVGVSVFGYLICAVIMMFYRIGRAPKNS